MNQADLEDRPVLSAAGQNAEDAGASLAAQLSYAEVRTIIIGILLAMFLAALNQTIIATALPTIGRDFNDFNNLSWVVTAYLLTSTAVAPLYGKLADIHGRRAIMLLGIGLFFAGSLVCAVSQSLTMLIVGRALQGLGGGGLLPLAQTIVADVTVARERGRYQALMGAMWVTAGIGGPIVGGLLAEHWHWSVIFWLYVPLSLAAAAMSSSSLKRLPRQGHRHKLDVVGAALMMSAAVVLLLALTWGGTRYPWFSPQIGGMIALSAVIAFAFARWLTVAREPFLPIPILRNQVVGMGTLSSACCVGTSIGLTIFLPLYCEAVYGLTASYVGLVMVPIAVMSTPGAILSGRSMMYFEHYKLVPIAGISMAAAAAALLAFWPTPPIAVMMLCLGFISGGCGTVYPVCTVCVQNAVGRHQIGTATGVMNFFRALASALVVAVMGAVVLAGFGKAPQRGMGSGDMSGVVTQATDQAGSMGVAMTFRWLFAAAVAFLVIGLIAMIAMREMPLPGKVRWNEKGTAAQ